MATSPAPRWTVADPDPATVESLQRALECSPVLATVLASRGITNPETASDHLEPTPQAIHPPSTLPDIQPAVERIEAALEADERIAVFADRDVDGSCGGTVLVHWLEQLGGDVRFDAPEKYDGYGLAPEHVDGLLERGVDLLVTVDCGTTAHESIAHAVDRGLDVIVTDHHDLPETLPPALACINPRRGGCPSDGLAGGAVAWKVGQALVEDRAPLEIETYHCDGLPLAAIATLGDYMPLTPENRAIVRAGYDRLEACRLAGVQTLADHCGVGRMRDLGWSVAPLLNAAQEAESGTLMHETLLAGDDEAIETLEAYRVQRNADRQERAEHLRARVDEQVDLESAFVIQVGVDRYVGGGPMSQLANEWGRPVIAYREDGDGWRGGGRTAGDVDLLAVYADCAGLFAETWGHPGAAGFRIDGASVAEVQDAIATAVRERYDPEDLRPTVDIDGVVAPKLIDRAVVDEIEQLAPFGPDNEEPQFLLEGLAVDDLEWFGADGGHCRLDGGSVDVVCWNGHPVVDDLTPPASLDVVGTLGIDDYTGRPTLTVEDCRPSGETAMRV